MNAQDLLYLFWHPILPEQNLIYPPIQENLSAAYMVLIEMHSQANPCEYQRHSSNHLRKNRDTIQLQKIFIQRCGNSKP
jgi:hypothetical protein